jgi:hypothetical protein
MFCDSWMNCSTLAIEWPTGRLPQHSITMFLTDHCWSKCNNYFLPFPPCFPFRPGDSVLDGAGQDVVGHPVGKTTFYLPKYFVIVRFEIVTVVLMKFQVLWYMLCRLLKSHWYFEGAFSLLVLHRCSCCPDPLCQSLIHKVWKERWQYRMRGKAGCRRRGCSQKKLQPVTWPALVQNIKWFVSIHICIQHTNRYASC